MQRNVSSYLRAGFPINLLYFDVTILGRRLNSWSPVFSVHSSLLGRGGEARPQSSGGLSAQNISLRAATMKADVHCKSTAGDLCVCIKFCPFDFRIRCFTNDFCIRCFMRCLHCLSLMQWLERTTHLTVTLLPSFWITPGSFCCRLQRCGLKPKMVHSGSWFFLWLPVLLLLLF